MFGTRCTKCYQRLQNFTSPLVPALADPTPRDIALEELPRCIREVPNPDEYTKTSVCGGLLRPDIVWFGETPYDQSLILKELQTCDLLLVIGTSGTVSSKVLDSFVEGRQAQGKMEGSNFSDNFVVSQVYPAAGYRDEISEDVRVAVFNLKNTEDDEVDFFFEGPCEETIPRVLGFVEG